MLEVARYVHPNARSQAERPGARLPNGKKNRQRDRVRAAAKDLRVVRDSKERVDIENLQLKQRVSLYEGALDQALKRVKELEDTLRALVEASSTLDVSPREEVICGSCLGIPPIRDETELNLLGDLESVPEPIMGVEEFHPVLEDIVYKDWTIPAMLALLVEESSHAAFAPVQGTPSLSFMDDFDPEDEVFALTSAIPGLGLGDISVSARYVALTGDMFPDQVFDIHTYRALYALFPGSFPDMLYEDFFVDDEEEEDSG